MRILMISDVYFPRINGVSTAIQTLRHELMALGHQVTLIAPQYDRPTDNENGILRVPARRVWLDPEDRMMSMRAILDLAPQLREQPFDLLHIHTPFIAHYAGLKLAKALNLPMVETYHTFFEEYLFHYIPFAPKPLMRFLARRFSRSQCNQVHGLIAPSTPMLDALRRYDITTHTAVIPTGLHLAQFAHGDGRQFRERHGIAPNRPMLLYVGRVAHEKNIHFLLDMLRQVRIHHPDVLLVIAGEGPAQKFLQQQTQRWRLSTHVHFVGYLDRQRELLDCYRAADLFVFASRTETQGLVLLEAMACGVPVVGLAIMGTAEVLQQGRGAHIARDDPRDFAMRVSGLLTNPAKRKQLAAHALDYVRGWSAQEMTYRLAEFYTQVHARHGAPQTAKGIASKESAAAPATAPCSATPDVASVRDTAHRPANAGSPPAADDSIPACAK